VDEDRVSTIGEGGGRFREIEMEKKGSLDDRPLKGELLTDKYHPQPVIFRLHKDHHRHLRENKGN